MGGGSVTEPILCPIITVDDYGTHVDMLYHVISINVNYSDITNALAFFVPTYPGNATAGGTASIKFTDGNHSVNFDEPNTVDEGGFMPNNSDCVFETIAPFAFVGSDRCIMQCDSYTTDGLMY